MTTHPAALLKVKYRQNTYLATPPSNDLNVIRDQRVSGLSSLAPGGGKMRDPGNEAGSCQVISIRFLPLNTILTIFIAHLWLNPSSTTIDHFTLVSSVTWPLNGSEAGGDVALIPLCICHVDARS